MLALSLALLAALPAQAAAQATSAPLAARASLALPDVEGRIDHLAVDLARGRGFVAALENGSVEVVDLNARTWLCSLRELAEPQGILYLPESDRLVVACGGDGNCVVFDGDTLELRARLPVGDDADNLRYDAQQKRVYVAFEGALGIVDVETWKLAGRVTLSGHPEGFQLDAAGLHAFVNLPGAREVDVIDLEARAVRAKWTVDEAQANYPLLLTPEGCVVLGCRKPGRLVVRASASGAPLQALELGGDVDDLFHDATKERVYALCGEGRVDVFACRGESGLSPLAKVATAAGARTGLFVPERGELLVAVPHRGGQRAELRVLGVGD